MQRGQMLLGIGIEKAQLDVARGGSQMKHLAAAVEIALPAERAPARGILIADAQRDGWVRHNVAIRAVFDERINRERHLARQIDDDVALDGGEFRRSCSARRLPRRKNRRRQTVEKTRR